MRWNTNAKKWSPELPSMHGMSAFECVCVDVAPLGHFRAIHKSDETKMKID